MVLEKARRAGKQFLAPVPTRVGGGGILFKVLWLNIATRAQRVPKAPPGPFRTDVSLYGRAPASGLRVTWFGHSSMLVEIDGFRLLLDPVWDERAGPVGFAGPKRFFPATLELSDLPPVDAVLMSHDHYDHLAHGTVETLAKMRPEMRWICPLAVGAILQGFGVSPERITELDWTESTVLSRLGGDNLTVTALPARHFSGRSPFIRNTTLWASFVLRGAAHSVYYGADSGMWEGFEQIGREYGPFDLTMLEIGASNALWADIHLGPDGAAEAFRMLGEGLLMPIHWGLFNLALHDWRQPIERIRQLAGEWGIALFSPEPGAPTEVTPGVISDWWRG